MAKAINNIPMVEQFEVNSKTLTNISKRWEIWKEDFQLFVVASGITNKPQKKAMLLHIGGHELREIYRTMRSEEQGRI